MEKIKEYMIDYRLVERYDIELLKQNCLVPIKEDDYYYTFGSNKEQQVDLDGIISGLNKPIKTLEFDTKQILQSLHKSTLKYELFEISKKSLLQSNDQDSNINRFLMLIIKSALEFKSSDIHIESGEECFYIRFRIDGVLKHFITLNKNFFNILSSYIKLKSNLDISLKRLPQDSRFSYTIESKTYEFRVSCVPTIEGESIVLRILENNTINQELSNLGFTQSDFKTIQKNINSSNGLILITGPTGSGKTTTLYSMIKELNKGEKKIITIEDPIEYKISGIQQIAVNNDIGLSFSKILSNILRQDPDVILIGEIRDKASLKIALQASLTGHLVLATLHTDSAINSINRVFDLEGEPFLLASTLKSIISQRLVRKLCNRCKSFDETLKSYKAQGCEECNYEGYSGRAMVYEMINMDQEISSMILKQQNTKEIKEHIYKTKFINIKAHGDSLIKEGKTTLEEIYKVL